MRTFKILFLLLILSGQLSAQADSYLYKRKLDNIPAAGYFSIDLQPEVLANMKSTNSDLRIYNITEKDTVEIPFHIQYFGTYVEESEISYERINDSYNQKCCSYLTLKLGKKQVVNRINLDVEENNFDKRVMVEGSNDNKQWFTIAEHLRIVRFKNGSENYTYSQLEIPNSEFSYIRLKFDDDSSPRITVKSANAFEDVTVEGKYIPISNSRISQTENKKEKISEVIVEYPMNYQFDYITLKSDATSDYYRNINIYRSAGTFTTAKGEQDSWVAVGSGVLTSKEDYRFYLFNTQTRKLKIEIVNYDDQPVKISEVKAFAMQIRLAAQLPASSNIYLFYGKEGDTGPVYDMAHFQEKIPENLTAINYGPEEVKLLPLKAGKEGLITNKTWLWIAMAVVIILIGYFALSMLKKEQE